MAVMDNFWESVNFRELVVGKIGLPKTNFINMVQVLVFILAVEFERGFKDIGVLYLEFLVFQGQMVYV